MNARAVCEYALIEGEVQGVGFRWFVRSCALRFSLTGWVRNRCDGAVELEAQGEPAALEAFFELVREGPRFAVVRSLPRRRVGIESGYHFEIVF